MRQFSFSVLNKHSSGAAIVRCTAPTAEWARLQIVSYYGNQFDVCDLPCDIDPPHKVLGEIDASSMTQRDADYLARGV